MSRCPSTLWCERHDVMLTLVRNAQGKPTGAIEWTCRKCLRVVGKTELKPSWSLLARMRRQLGRVKARKAS
jgi:hypothetical protein